MLARFLMVGMQGLQVMSRANADRSWLDEAQVQLMQLRSAMSVELVLEVESLEVAQTVFHALDAYKAKLRASIQRSRRNLKKFEERYGVTTAIFLDGMAAEYLAGGDLDYVEWAGEAKLLERLEAELRALENVRYRVT